MKAADWIALYAAGIGTAAFVWQWITYISAHRPNIQIDIMLMHFLRTLDDADAHKKSSEITGHWRIQIEILNLGRSPVRIGAVAIETNPRSSGFDRWESANWDLPWLLG